MGWYRVFVCMNSSVGENSISKTTTTQVSAFRFETECEKERTFVEIGVVEMRNKSNLALLNTF